MPPTNSPYLSTTTPLMGASTTTYGSPLNISGGMPVYSSSSGSVTYPVPAFDFAVTGAMVFRAGEQRYNNPYKMQMRAPPSNVHSEYAIGSVYWDIVPLPPENPLEDLVGMLEGDDTDPRTAPMGILTAALWTMRLGALTLFNPAPLTLGLPTGPLPRHGARGGLRLPRPFVGQTYQNLDLEISFQRPWCPRTDVEVRFTLEVQNT